MTPNVRVTNAGELRELTRLLPTEEEEAWKVFLYTGRTAGDVSDLTIVDFTEPDFSGYIREDVVGWTILGDDTTGRQVATGVPVTFTVVTAGSLPIMGRGLLDSDGNVYAAGDFPTPFDLISGFDFIVPVSITARSEV